MMISAVVSNRLVWRFASSGIEVRLADDERARLNLAFESLRQMRRRGAERSDIEVDRECMRGSIRRVEACP